MEIPGLKEANTFAPAHISKQEEFGAIGGQLGLIGFAPLFEIFHKLKFALIQDNRQDGDFAAAPDVEEWFKEVVFKGKGAQPTNGH